MSLLSQYLERVEFNSYEDFYANFRLRIPDNFNFSYDVVDWYAEHEPSRVAMLWCDDHGQELTFTFK